MDLSESTPLDLAALLQRIWPSASDQGRLLDLPERKRWTPIDRAHALDRAAAWLNDVLGLGRSVSDAAAVPTVTPADLRALARELAPGPTGGVDGVSKALTAIAPAVGSTAKTLANSLSTDIRVARPDHRWLLAIHRIVKFGGPIDAWVYHRRTRQVVSAELSARALTAGADAGDALLLFSLLALWQRRRPTVEVRSNRAQPKSRSTTPKPLASLKNALVHLGQLPHLTTLAHHIGGPRGAALLLLAIEAALTTAHLAPHADRRDGHVASGEEWLRATTSAIDAGRRSGLLGEMDADVLVFRVAVMRAYRDTSRAVIASPLAATHPYVQATQWLRDRAPRPESPPDLDGPGVLMLQPMFARRRA